MHGSRLTWASLILACMGTIVAAYLVIIHYREHALVCGIGNCEKVQTSSYAELAGVPIAWLGLAMYLVILGLTILREARPTTGEVVTVALFGLTLAGTLYVAYLTYLEIWVIEAICQWCVAFAIITVLMFVGSTIRLARLFIHNDSEPSRP
jgi:uncharacterized membrane protein